jgi:hypothetical protein
MDLSSIPVVDNHCHFFNLTCPEQPLHKMLTLSLNSLPDDQLRYSFLYRLIISGLSELLGCPPDEQSVLAARNDLAKQDYGRYVKNLFEDVTLKGFLVDIGLQKSLVSFDDFERLSAQKVWYVYRIETVVDRLWQEKIDPARGMEIFRAEVKDAIKTLPAVALKSIIGYRTGLRIDPEVSVKQVSRKMDEQAYRNLFFMESARICREEGIPLHVHAAFGESNIDLRENNPLHLKPYLDSSPGRGIDTVLIHGGYPYAFEAGYLAAMFPRVYLDISELLPFVTMGARRGVEDLMSMCPWNKIMYGSDGFDVPETHWFGVRMGKQVIGSILGDLIKEGKIDREFAEEIAQLIFHRTTLGLHRLPLLS